MVIEAAFQMSTKIHTLFSETIHSVIQVRAEEMMSSGPVKAGKRRVGSQSIQNNKIRVC